MATLPQTKHAGGANQESGLSQTASPSETTLIHLSKTVIELMNNRCYDHPWFRQYVSPDVRVDLAGKVTTGLADFIGNYKVDSSNSSNFQVVIENVTATVNERSRQGTVILSQYLSGYQSDERKMAGTILMTWEKVRGQWTNMSVTMLLGTPEFLL